MFRTLSALGLWLIIVAFLIIAHAMNIIIVCSTKFTIAANNYIDNRIDKKKKRDSKLNRR